jgi:hypothetical protein
MISRTRGTPIMKEITIMKTAGRLFSNIEFITVVALTALALVTVVAGGGAGDGAGGVGPAAGTILEIFCKALVALVNAAVVFSKALVVFSNLSLTVSDIATPPVAFVVVSLVNPAPSVVVLVLMGSVALGVGEGRVVATTTALSEDKLSMNNRDTRMTAITVFIYTLLVLFIVY